MISYPQKINLSLTTLGICIKHLTEGKPHVPFRESKLTFFLKESLGGNSKTTLVCTASKRHVYLDDSVQTLKFAQRAKKIRNKAITNLIVLLLHYLTSIQKSPKEMEQLIVKLKVEVQTLKKYIIEQGLNPQHIPMISSSKNAKLDVMDNFHLMREVVVPK